MSVGTFVGGVIAIQGRGAVVLTAMDVEHRVAGTATAGIRFNTDGSIDQLVGASYSQINTGEWWDREPEASIGDDYDVRALSSGKVGTWDTAAEVDDTWIQISSNREWINTRAAPGEDTTSATFEIRLTGSGSALDSATGTCIAENNT